MSRLFRQYRRAGQFSPVLGLTLSALMLACGPAGSSSTSETAASATPGPQDPITRDNDALFQTDSLAYTLRAGHGGFDGQIGVTFTNRSVGTVYFGNCHGVTSLWLQKRIAGRWQTAWNPPIPLCRSPPIAVRAGATHRTRLWIYSGYPGTNSFPQFSITDIAGEYRVVWGEASRSQRSDVPSRNSLLPIEQRVSNRFMLETERR